MLRASEHLRRLQAQPRASAREGCPSRTRGQPWAALVGCRPAVLRAARQAPCAQWLTVSCTHTVGAHWQSLQAACASTFVVLSKSGHMHAERRLDSLVRLHGSMQQQELLRIISSEMTISRSC